MSRETEIGTAADFEALPAQVDLEGTPYWLVRKEDGGYALLMALCPHAGGEVLAAKDAFFCPLHFWTFDPASGVCLNAPDERLVRRDVEEREGRLYAVGDPY